jgi:hypothetical protein
MAAGVLRMRAASSLVVMYGEAVLVSLIVGLRSVSFEVGDGASEGVGDACHDLGLGVALSAFDAGQVCM